jgi:hypothetical protein
LKDSAKRRQLLHQNHEGRSLLKSPLEPFEGCVPVTEGRMNERYPKRRDAVGRPTFLDLILQDSGRIRSDGSA